MLTTTQDREVKRGEHGVSLIAYLRKTLMLSGKTAKRLLDSRQVFVNGQRIWMARHPLAAGDRVRVVAPLPGRQEAAEPHVLLRGQGYLVIDKPPGVLCQGGGSIEALLRKRLANPDLTCVHRLDKDTSGCLLLAENQDVRDRLVAAFTTRDVFKLYHAIVHGRIGADTRTVRAPIGGKRAATRIRILARGPKASHIQAVIETGRTHQIRIHMASIHHPVVGDGRYTHRRRATEQTLAAPRQMLHAAKLHFPDPGSGNLVRVESPLPADFRTRLAACKLT